MSLRQQNPWSRVGQLMPSGSGSGTRPAGLPVEMVVTSFVNDALRDPNWRQTNVDLTIDDPVGFDVFDMYGKVIDHLPKGAVVKVWQVAQVPVSGPMPAGPVPVKVRVARNVNWGVPNSLVQNLPEEMYFTVVGYGPPLGVHVSWAERPGQASGSPPGSPPNIPPPVSPPSIPPAGRYLDYEIGSFDACNDIPPLELAQTRFVDDALADPNWCTVNYVIRITRPGGYNILGPNREVIGNIPYRKIANVWQHSRAIPGYRRIIYPFQHGMAPRSVIQEAPQEVWLPDSDRQEFGPNDSENYVDFSGTVGSGYVRMYK